MKQIIWAFGILAFVGAFSNQAIAKESAPFNELVLQTVHKMPSFGGYSVNPVAFDHLKKAIAVKDGILSVHPEAAQPSFCSSSTYLVFTEVLAQLQRQGRLQLTATDWKSFLVADPSAQPDGHGIWGRWNANGPGTARLFSELRLGRNFTNLHEALPGDFLKIFWNDEIGVKEKGHSVIFIGTKSEAKGRTVCYWSSNQSYDGEPEGGMGTKCSDEKKIHRMLFSRLETPKALEVSLKEISKKSKKYADTYLHNLLRVATSPEEMCGKVYCSK